MSDLVRNGFSVCVRTPFRCCWWHMLDRISPGGRRCVIRAHVGTGALARTAERSFAPKRTLHRPEVIVTRLQP